MNPVKEITKHMPNMVIVLTGVLQHLEQHTVLLEQIRDQHNTCACKKEEIGEVTSENTESIE